MGATIKSIHILALSVLLVFAGFSCRQNKQRAPDGVADPPDTTTDPVRTPADADRACINLNSAMAEELMTLPGVGKVTAAKIIEFRERHGPFRRPQDIIIIHGLSERKYRKLAEFVCAK